MCQQVMSSKKKGSVGRQKIRMAKIEKESQRQVTFSKRRAGLFKKASELCTLCGVEMAIIVFSPAKKPFSFGQPQGKNAAVRSELSLVLTQMEEEKKKGDAMRKATEMVKWSVEEMSLLQLQQMKSALEELRNIMVVTPPSYKDMSSGFSSFNNFLAMDM